MQKLVERIARDTKRLPDLAYFLSRDLYEDVHEILMTQLQKVFQAVTAERAEVGIHFCDQHIKQLLDIFETAWASHDRSMNIITDCNRNPDYCLYLRNFEMGRNRFSVNRNPHGNDDKYLFLGDQSFSDHDVQLLLATSYSDSWDLVGVQNMWSLSDKYLKYTILNAKANMIFLAIDNWKTYVAALIKDAPVIILHLDSLSEGVVWEINEIRNNNCQQKTIILATKKLKRFGNEDGILSALFGEDARLAGPGVRPISPTETQLQDFQDVFGEFVNGFSNIVICGEEVMDLNCVEKALDVFLETQRQQPPHERHEALIKPLEFNFSSSLGTDLRNWGRSALTRVNKFLDHILFSRNERSISLTAAASQTLIAYAFLVSDFSAMGKGLAILAAIEDHPKLKDEKRKTDGRTRGELARENLLRARHYFEITGNVEQSEDWFKRAKSILESDYFVLQLLRSFDRCLRSGNYKIIGR